jgi:hypothetical protein
MAPGHFAGAIHAVPITIIIAIIIVIMMITI